MRIVFVGATLLWAGVATAQVVTIPDPAFKTALLADTSINTNKDMEIQSLEAAQVRVLLLGSRQIKDLTGIEAFTSLNKLHCQNNQLVNLNVRKLTSLVELKCTGNGRLTELDVTQNTSLRVLDINLTKIERLDISQNKRLLELSCVRTPIAELDVRANTNLSLLACGATNIQSLDLSRNLSLNRLLVQGSKLKQLNLQYNTKLAQMYCTASPDLDTICVPSVASALANAEFVKDTTAIWSETCVQPLATTSQEKAADYLLYPNPTKGLLFLADGIQTAHIYNGVGELLGEYKEGVIDMHSFPSGIYHVKWFAGSHSAFQRIVKE